MIVLEESDEETGRAINRCCECSPEDTIGSLGASDEQKFVLEMK